MKRKNIFKSLLAAAMALIMIFGAAPLSGFVGIRLPMLSLKAEAATTEDGLFEYEVEENGTGSEYQCGVRITRYKGPDSGEVVIPKTIGGYEVKWIGSEWEDKAFQGCTGITSIVIPDSVISIDRSAFSGCTSLTEIVIPDSVTEIGRSAFEGCTSLSKVKLSKNLTGIGSGVFSGCTSLAEITIPDGVTSIVGSAFSGCTSLAEIVIPDSVTSIGEWAFSGCTSLTEITILDSVTEIGRSAFEGCTSLSKVKLSKNLTGIGSGVFSGCTSLAEITISSDNKNFSSVDGVLFSKDMSTLLVYPAGSKRSTYIVPDGVTEIGNDAFYRCTSLSKVQLSNGLTKIGNYAFRDCINLTEITIPDSVTSIGRFAFSGCTSLSKVDLPKNLTGIYSGVFSGCTSLAEITIPDSVTEIGDSAFSDCTSLAELTIPDGVTEIGYDAFCYCTSLSKVKLPNSLTTIGYSAFRGCINLTDITISSDNKNFSSVDGVLFSKDMSILLAYPAGNNRSTYTVPDGVTEIGNGAFYRCTSLSKVKLPNGVTKIGDSAFDRCENLTEIVIPDSVTEIGWSAFSGCTSLTEIVIPDSVTEIGSFAFSGCTSLSKVQLPNGVTKIGDSAFYYCTSLTEITIPDSVTQIEVSAFSGCTSLKELTIPDSVISIGGYAFSGCTSIAEITVSPDNKNYVSVDGVLFSKDMSALLAYPAGNKRSTYTVPDSVTKIDDAAFFGCVYLTDITVSSDNKNYVSVDGVLFTKNMSTLVAYPAGNERSTYTIPYGVKKICVLAYCENLKEIVFPDSVIDASSELFMVGCCSLTNIVVSPGNNIFWSADGVLFANIEVNFLVTYPAANERSTYTIPDGVEIIYPEAFAHSKNLKSVTISESVTAIYESAFMCCTSLREITIPKSVIEIKDSAFENCDSLKNVYYLGTRAQWKAVVIGTKNEALTRATVHCIDDPPCDHVWGEWEVVEEATYEKEGLERRACSRCNIEETRVIPKLVRASAIELSESEKTVFVGDTFTITATVKPEDAFNRTVTWSSSDPSIATVDENGTVTAIAKGEAIITAESADGVKAECKVTVEKKVAAIELSESEKTVFVCDTFTITATVKPEDAFNRTVTWSSSDPSIATVDENGTVTAIAKGEAIITAESADGVKAECKVTVEKKDGFFKTLLKIITAPFRAIIYLFKKLFGK